MIKIGFVYENEISINGVRIITPNTLHISGSNKRSTPKEGVNMTERGKEKDGIKSRFSPAVPLFILNHLLYLTLAHDEQVVDLSYFVDNKSQNGMSITGPGGMEKAIELLNRVFNEYGFPELLIERVWLDKIETHFYLKFKNADMLFNKENTGVIWDTNINNPNYNDYWKNKKKRNQNYLVYNIYSYEDAKSTRDIVDNQRQLSHVSESWGQDLNIELLPRVVLANQLNSHNNLCSFFSDKIEQKNRDSNNDRLILFDGPVGVGKSYSLYHLINEYSSKGCVAVMTDVKALVQSKTTLLHWLLQSIELQGVSDPKEEFRKISSRNKNDGKVIVFAIDGFDEINPENYSPILEDVKWLISYLDNVYIILGMQSADLFYKEGSHILQTNSYLHVRAEYYTVNRFKDPYISAIIRKFPEAGTPLFVKRYMSLPQETIRSNEIRSYYDLYAIQYNYRICKSDNTYIGSFSISPILYEYIIPYLAYITYVDKDSHFIIDELLEDSNSIVKDYLLAFQKIENNTDCTTANTDFSYIEYFFSLSLPHKIELLQSTGEFQYEKGNLCFVHNTLLQFYASLFASKIIMYSDCENQKESIRNICYSISSYEEQTEFHNNSVNLKSVFFCFCLFRELERNTKKPIFNWESSFDLLSLGLSIGTLGNYDVYRELRPLLSHVFHQFDLYIKNGKKIRIRFPSYNTIRAIQDYLRTVVDCEKESEEELDKLDDVEHFYMSILGYILRQFYDAFSTRSFNRSPTIHNRIRTYFNSYKHKSSIIKHIKNISSKAEFGPDFDILNLPSEPNIQSFSWESGIKDLDDICYLVAGLLYIIDTLEESVRWNRNKGIPTSTLVSFLLDVCNFYTSKANTYPTFSNERKANSVLALHINSFSSSFAKCSVTSDCNSFLIKIDSRNDIVDFLTLDYRSKIYAVRYLLTEEEYADDAKFYRSKEAFSICSRLLEAYGYDAFKILLWGHNESVEFIKNNYAVFGLSGPYYCIDTAPPSLCLYLAESFYNYFYLGDATDMEKSEAIVSTMMFIYASYDFLEEYCTGFLSNELSIELCEKHRVIIDRLWQDLCIKYIPACDSIKDDEILGEVLETINLCLNLYRQINPHYDIVEYTEAADCSILPIIISKE